MPTGEPDSNGENWYRPEDIGEFPDAIMRRPRARTPAAAERLIRPAGLQPASWRRLFDLGPLPFVQAVTAGADLRST